MAEKETRTLTTAISENSTMQIGLVVTLVGFLVGAIWWASDMNTRLGHVQESTNKIQIQLEAATVNRWTKIDHDAFASTIVTRIQELEKVQRENQNKILSLELKSKP